MKLAYLHLSEPEGLDIPKLDSKFRLKLRTIFNGKIIVAGGYSVETGIELIENDLVDLVAFGRPYIANPDFPLRAQNNWTLNIYDPSVLYGGDYEGYTTFKSFQNNLT